MIERTLRQLALSRHWPILAATAVLVAIGVVTIHADDPAAGRKQLVFLGIAAACLAAFQAVDYRIIGKYAGTFYVLAAGLIAYTVLGSIVTVPGVVARNAAYNWIAFGPLALQPSELMKVAFVMVMARYLRFRSNYRTLGGLVAPFLLAALPMLLILKQPDLGTALVFIPTLFAMLYVAGAKRRHLAAVVLAAAVAMPFLWMSGQHWIRHADGATRTLCGSCSNVPGLNLLPQFVKHYQRERLFDLFTDDLDLSDSTLQIRKAMTAQGSGGFFGNGVGDIRFGQTVPEGRNDMIFALIGEQFGFVGSTLVIAMYLVIFVTGLWIAGGTREPFGRLVAIGIVVMLAGQMCINLMVVMKLMPVTGVTLPFVSSGGSSLIASFMSIGLLLNVGQRRPIVMARESFDYE
ncbi:MAG TPA: FtsW/RodA/SpoVE family cell cycle protein [Tepidisphaeraceae bacterium]